MATWGLTAVVAIMATTVLGQDDSATTSSSAKEVPTLYFNLPAATAKSGKSRGGLSKGAIGGIVAAVVILLLLIAGLLFFLWRRKQHPPPPTTVFEFDEAYLTQAAVTPFAPRAPGDSGPASTFFKEVDSQATATVKARDFAPRRSQDRRRSSAGASINEDEKSGYDEDDGDDPFATPRAVTKGLPDDDEGSSEPLLASPEHDTDAGRLVKAESDLPPMYDPN